MKTIIINNYCLDNKTFSATCDEKPLSLYSAASKASAVSRRSFGFFQRVYTYFLDLLASIGCLKQHRFELLKENVGEIEKAQNLFLKWRSELAKFVDEHYVRIAGNVKHLDEAEVIGLGETHIISNHRVRNAKIIDKLAEPGDLILVEHDESQEFRSDQAESVESEIPVLGWDDRSGKSDEAATRLQTNFTLGVLSVPTFFINPILGALLAGSSIRYFWSQGKKDGEIIDSELPMRNESMCRTIDQQLKKGRRIYVIAGSGHFKVLDEESKTQKKMYDLTIHHLSKKNYMLLVPKNSWS